MSSIQIEYASLMTPSELTGYYGSIIARHKKNKTRALDLLEEKTDLLRVYYDRYEKKRIEEFYARMKEIADDEKAWKEKKCTVCGATMRRVESDYGVFWGCPNFRDGRKHNTFSLTHDEDIARRKAYAKVRIRANWISDIITDMQLPSYVRATDALIALERLGLEDLRFKYGYRKSTETISGYVLAKKASLEEEREITAFLTPFFSRSVVQQGIRYKLKNGVEKVAILDLVLGNEKTVFVVEIKREALHLNEEQLELYYILLKHILSTQIEVRECKALFIAYTHNQLENYSWLTTKFLQFDTLRECSSKDELLHLLIDASIY